MSLYFFDTKDVEMTAVPKSRLTPAEYLTIERRAAFKSEFFAGEMIAMAGASREHNLIVGNLVRELGLQLKNRPCEVYPSDMRVRLPSGLYTYPDVSVDCGPPQFEGAEMDVLLNPLLLIEVLSDSTKAYDRGTKFRHYRQLASLREYILVEQTAPQLEQFVREDNGKWELSEVTGLDGTLVLEAVCCSINCCSINVAEIYSKVEFPPASEDNLR